MKAWSRPEGVKIKVLWNGEIVSIQPRIRLTRSFDQRSHNYSGFTLTLEGTVDGEERAFTVGIGKETQAKHQFKAWDVASGKSEQVQDPKTEVSEYYKTSEVKILERSTQQEDP